MLEGVFQFVIAELTNTGLGYFNDAEHQKLHNFLHGLRNSEHFNCKRLLICLGIDLKNYKTIFGDTNEYICFIEILRFIICDINEDESLLSFREKPIPKSILFSLSLLRKQNFVFSTPFIKAEERARYARISTFFSYYKYIVIPNVQNSKLLKEEIAEDFDDNELNVYYEKLCERILLHKLPISCLSSKTGWVFVANRDEIDEELSTKNIDKLVNSLGFYTQNIDPMAKYIWLEYPESEFDEALYQPTVLTGDWGNCFHEKIDLGNEFFLSFGGNTDKWGKTHTVDGKSECIKERVHRKFDHGKNLTYSFAAYELGSLNSTNININLDSVISEALFRFSQIN